MRGKDIYLLRMTENTKGLLINSLNDLLEEKPISKISIRELTELAGVNRQTFYYHYSDIYELLEDLVLFDFNKYKEDLSKDDITPIVYIYKVLKKKKVILNNIYDGSEIKKINRVFINYVRVFLDENLDNYENAENLSEDDRDFIIKFFSFVIVGIIHMWVEDGMPDTLYKDLNRAQNILELAIELAVYKFTSE